MQISENEDGKSRCPNVISMQLAGGFLNSLLHEQFSLVKSVSYRVRFHSIRDWTSSVACQAKCGEGRNAVRILGINAISDDAPFNSFFREREIRAETGK